MSQMIDTWQALDLRRRVVLLGALALTFIAVLSLAQIATKPSMALLYSGLDPAAAGEVVGMLEQMNVESEVRGDAIYVSEGARDRVRLALARDGLPRQGQAGYELLDEISGFSATTDMFNAAYWRAKEGELARTVIAAPGVRSARVHIAVPNRRPFARAGAGPTASVTVTTSSGSLGVDQAMAIRYVVALAVADLSPDQVAVIDGAGKVILAPGTDNPLSSASSQASDREAKIKAEVEELLSARVGRDRVRVSVTVETDREAETVTERVIKPETRVTIHSNTEEISDSAQGSNGAVTVASNLPAGDANANNERQSARTESREQVNYDYTIQNRETTRQAGAIRRVSVAVLVDGVIVPNADGEGEWQPRPQAELDTLRELVVAAVGFDADRGDVVTVESMAFQPDATPGALVEVSPIMRFIERNAMTMIQLAFLGVVAIVLSMTVIKPLLAPRPMNDDFPGMTIAASSDAGDGDSMDDLPSLASMGTGPEMLSGFDQLEDGSTPSEALRDVVAERPEQTVATLKAWLDDSNIEEEEAA